MRKSWLALGLCTAVASGGVALGKIPVERGEALYAALEDNERRLQRRSRLVLQGLASPETPEGFYYATAWPRLNEGGAAALHTWLSEHPDCRLVVLDTLAKVRPRNTRSGSSGYQDDYEALEELLPIAAEHGVAIVVVTHTRKAGASDVMDEINATMGLMGGVDGTLIFRAERNKPEASMHVDGRDIEEAGEKTLRWDQQLHGWVLVESPGEETRLTEDRRAILDVLREARGPVALKDIASEVGKSKSAVSNLMGKLAVDDRVISAGYGRWQLSSLQTELSPTFTGKDESSVDGNPVTYHGFGEDSPLSPDSPHVHPDTVRRTGGESGESGESPHSEREKLSPWGGDAGESSPHPPIPGRCKHDVRGGCWLCRKRAANGGQNDD